MSRRRACGGVAAFAAALVLCGAAPPATAAPYIAVACAESAGLLTLHDHTCPLRGRVGARRARRPGR